MDKILIAIPCFNCSPQAQRVARHLDHFLSKHSLPIAEILFIDNCSTDSTFTDLEKLIPHLQNAKLFRVKRNPQNLGLGGSQKEAFRWLLHSDAHFLAIVHGDNQADVTDLAALWKVSLANKSCTVLGSRFSDLHRLKNYSLLRSTGNIALNAVYSLFLRKKVSDLGSGLNLFAKKDFLNDDKFLQFDDGFTFNMDLLIYLSQKPQPLVFCPISWKSEDEKSNASAFRVGWKALTKIIVWARQ